MTSVLDDILSLKQRCFSSLFNKQTLDNQVLKKCLGISLIAIASASLAFTGFSASHLMEFSLPLGSLIGIGVVDVVMMGMGIQLLRSITDPEDMDNLETLKRKISLIIEKSDIKPLKGEKRRKLLLEQINSLQTKNLNLEDEEVQTLLKLKELDILSFIFNWLEKKRMGKFDQEEFNLSLELLLGQLQSLNKDNLNVEEVQKILDLKKTFIHNFIAKGSLSSSLSVPSIPR